MAAHLSSPYWCVCVRFTVQSEKKNVKKNLILFFDRERARFSIEGSIIIEKIKVPLEGTTVV